MSQYNQTTAPNQAQSPNQIQPTMLDNSYAAQNQKTQKALNLAKLWADQGFGDRATEQTVSQPAPQEIKSIQTNFDSTVPKTAINIEPPKVPDMSWLPKMDLDQGVLAGLLSLVIDSAKNAASATLKKTGEVVQKQGAQIGKQVQAGVNSFDLGAFWGAPKPTDRGPAKTYSTPDQHLKVLTHGSAQKELDQNQHRQLQETRSRITRLLSESRNAKRVISQEDRRLAEAQQALTDPRVASQYRSTRHITSKERQALENQEGEVNAILLMRNRRRQAADIASQPLPETGSVQPKGMLGKAKKKVSSWMNNLGIKSSRADHGEAKNQAGG